jgi:excinuclease UvrABC nuclease subunit
VTKLKSKMKRVLSVTFPEFEGITGIFTKSTLQLLTQFPSMNALRKADFDTVAAIVIRLSSGQKIERIGRGTDGCRSIFRRALESG